MRDYNGLLIPKPGNDYLKAKLKNNTNRICLVKDI